MNKYVNLTGVELIELLDARDTEIEILSRSCQNLLKENFKLQNRFKDIALDYGLDNFELDELIKGKKDPDSGFEGSTLFPKGEGRKVCENDAGTIFIWD